MNILFLTGTRADYGKIKVLIDSVINSDSYSASMFVTGMHMLSLYGSTHEEISENHSDDVEIYKFINQNLSSTMDEILSKTVLGLSDYVKEYKPNMIVIHGDRVETLAGVIVASLNNIPSIHIEGGEVSGTIDELIRHAVSKMATIHCVSNDEAMSRLLQMGENEDKIRVIGSPDVDVMLSEELPTLDVVKTHYDINFNEYGLLLFHPVTTEVDQIESQINTLINAICKSKINVIVIFPNNDLGSIQIINAYKNLPQNFYILPPMRFEFFITLLKNSSLIIGNSSAGVREAPYFGVPTINVGTRQNDRSIAQSVFNIEGFEEDTLAEKIIEVSKVSFPPSAMFGSIGTANRFMEMLNNFDSSELGVQKYFINLKD
mgnify:CR=1 FL=1